MKIAIVGSRDYKRLDKVRAFVASLPKDTVIISGGAAGVDLEAERAADKLGLKKEIFPADWNNLSHPDAVIRTNKFGKKYDAIAGHRRNKLIVESADLVYAFWDRKSSGTKNSIQLAQKMGKEVVIFDETD
jgi:predicted Rossmann fold nucleotide-binding protein DprA/Smf involved in DNA uptake